MLGVQPRNSSLQNEQNVQHRTLNIEHRVFLFRIGRWMLDVRCSFFLQSGNAKTPPCQEFRSVRRGHDISENVKQALLLKGPDVLDVVVHLEPAD